MTALREWSESGSHDSANGINRRQLLLLSAFGLVAGAPALGAPPKGELTWGVHVSLAPSWFAQIQDFASPALLDGWA